MDDDFGGALGDLSGSEPESDAALVRARELLSDGDAEDGAGDEFAGSDDDDDDGEADGVAGGMVGDTSDDDGEEGPEAGGSGSEEPELETRAERQSRRLDKLKWVACPAEKRRTHVRCMPRCPSSRPLCVAIALSAAR